MVEVNLEICISGNTTVNMDVHGPDLKIFSQKIKCFWNFFLEQTWTTVMHVCKLARQNDSRHIVGELKQKRYNRKVNIPFSLPVILYFLPRFPHNAFCHETLHTFIMVDHVCYKKVSKISEYLNILFFAKLGALRLMSQNFRLINPNRGISFLGGHILFFFFFCW